MRVLHVFGMAFALQKQVYKLHRAGTIHGYTCNHVFKVVRLKLRHKLFHAAAFKLEHRLAVARRNEFVHLVVFVSELVEVKFYALVLFDEFQSLVDVGERFQSQKVHFEKSEFFDDNLVELRGYDIVFS